MNYHKTSITDLQNRVAQAEQFAKMSLSLSDVEQETNRWILWTRMGDAVRVLESGEVNVWPYGLRVEAICNAYHRGEVVQG